MDTFFLFLPFFITYLFLTDFKTPVNVWGSLTLSLASLGGIYSVADHFHARILEKIVNPNLIRGLNQFSAIIFVKTPLCLFPVAFLLFAVYYFHWHEHQTRPMRPRLTPIIFFPAVIMYFIPLDPKDYLSLRQFLIITDLWAFPYLTMVYILLYKSIAHNRKFETDRLLSIITIITMSATYIATVYLLPLFHFPLFKLNLYLLIIFFGLFFLLITKYGFLGVKLSVRNIYLDHNLKTVDSGVSVLNYQIKDQLGQIIACARDIDATAEIEQDLIVEKAQTISAAAAQALQVTQQLHYYLDKITPQPRQLNLAELAREAIASFRTQIKEKTLRIVNHLPLELIIESDPIYLTKVLKHILQNALEATAPGGSIKIDVTLSKREVTLFITDTGCGISPSERPQILKPFYTTKDRGSHFGLGLSYCYNVMQHLGGRLEIDSTVHSGTTVILTLPVS